MSERGKQSQPRMGGEGRGGCGREGGSGLGSGGKGCGRDRHQPGTGSERARLRHGAGSREASGARELALNERVSAVACLISLCFRYPIRLSLSLRPIQYNCCCIRVSLVVVVAVVSQRGHVLLAPQYAIGSRPMSHTQAAFLPTATIRGTKIYCITKDRPSCASSLPLTKAQHNPRPRPAHAAFHTFIS